MIKTCNLLLLFGLFSCSFGNAAEMQVEFILHSPDIPSDTAVYITGGSSELGSWNPSKVRMTFSGDHKWTHTITLKNPRTLEYKYTLGSWNREGATARGGPLPNFTVTVEESLTKEDTILFWTEGEKPTFEGQITGTVRYHRQLEGEGIASRDVIVWLPPSYNDSSARYPVLYMHDGQNIVDPKTSAFGVDWQIDETCTELIKNDLIPPLIVVGIYNTPARSLEYLPGPIGQAYRKFIVNQLKPFIDAEYRTLPDRENTFAGGSSAGGLCAFILAWEHSQVFSKAICMSPAFQYRLPDGSLRVDYVKKMLVSENPEEKMFFYIDNGGVGLERNLQAGVNAMLDALKEKGFKETIDFSWHPAPEARHDEAAWAVRFPQAIQLIMNGKIAEKKPEH